MKTKTVEKILEKQPLRGGGFSGLAQGQRSLCFLCHVLNLNADHMETWSSGSTNEPKGQNMNPNSFPDGRMLSLLQRGKAFLSFFFFKLEG